MGIVPPNGRLKCVTNHNRDDHVVLKNVEGMMADREKVRVFYEAVKA